MHFKINNWLPNHLVNHLVGLLVSKIKRLDPILQLFFDPLLEVMEDYVKSK